MRRSLFDRRRRAVLRIRDVRTPHRDIAFVVHFGHRNMSHETRRRCSVPVIFARLEEDAITGADHFDWASATLRKSEAFGYVDRLTIRMRVPRRSRPRREMNGARIDAENARRRGYRIEEHRTREPIAWAGCRLVYVSRELHQYRMTARHSPGRLSPGYLATRMTVVSSGSAGTLV